MTNQAHKIYNKISMATSKKFIQCTAQSAQSAQQEDRQKICNESHIN